MKVKDTILVTGAGGFVGGRLVEALYLSKFANVRAGIRRWSNAARIARFPIDIVLCDIMQPAQINKAMAGVTAVIHCAYNDTRDVIVQGTQNMLEAAQRSGVQRFVYLSTAEVYGNDVSGLIDEMYPYQFTGREYSDSKIEAEKLCWEFYKKGLPLAILRPSIVYGPFSKSWLVGMAKRLSSGNWGIFEDYGDGNCNLVYVDDLVSAVFLSIQTAEAVGQAFNINGPDVISWNEYFKRLNGVLGLPQLISIPSKRSNFQSMLRDQVSKVTGFFLSRFGDLIMKIYLRGGVIGKMMKRTKESLFTTPSTIELQKLYNRKAIYNAAKAQKLLGYKPKFNLTSGLHMSALWLNHHGYLKTLPPCPKN